MNYNEVNNYRKIKFKYIPATNHRGARISVYESARWNRDKTRRIYLSKDYECNTIDEQVFNYLKDKGFNIVGKGYENEYGLFFVDNWGDDYIEVNGEYADNTPKYKRNTNPMNYDNFFKKGLIAR